MAVRNVTVTMSVSEAERTALEQLYAANDSVDAEREQDALHITTIRDVLVGDHGTVVQVTVADPRGSEIASDVVEQRLRQRLAEVTPGTADAD